MDALRELTRTALAHNPEAFTGSTPGLDPQAFSRYGNINQLNRSSYQQVFDSEFYLERNPDVKAVFGNNANAAFEHFLHCGQFEGRDPNAFFQTGFYLAVNTDVATVVDAEGTTAIAHFLRYGEFENRQFSVLADPNEYLENNPDVAAVVKQGVITMFEHLITCGQFENRQILPEFDADYYLQQNTDLKAMVDSNPKFSLFRHLAVYGQFELRDPSGEFSSSKYRTEVYHDAVTSPVQPGVSSLMHFLLMGEPLFYPPIVSDPLTLPDPSILPDPPIMAEPIGEVDWYLGDTTTGKKFITLDSSNPVEVISLKGSSSNKFGILTEPVPGSSPFIRQELIIDANDDGYINSGETRLNDINGMPGWLKDDFFPNEYIRLTLLDVASNSLNATVFFFEF